MHRRHFSKNLEGTLEWLKKKIKTSSNKHHERLGKSSISSSWKAHLESKGDVCCVSWTRCCPCTACLCELHKHFNTTAQLISGPEIWI